MDFPINGNYFLFDHYFTVKQTPANLKLFYEKYFPTKQTEPIHTNLKVNSIQLNIYFPPSYNCVFFTIIFNFLNVNNLIYCFLVFFFEKILNFIYYYIQREGETLTPLGA